MRFWTAFRYFLQLDIKRTFSDVHKERTIWVKASARPNPMAIPQPKPLITEIGLENFFHVQITFETTQLGRRGILQGTILYLLARTEIREAHLRLVRREVMVVEGEGGGEGEPLEHASRHQTFDDGTILGTHQIMQGPAYRGDQIPFRLHLGSVLDEEAPVSTSTDAIGNLFHIRYYAMLVFIDREERKYFKLQEITILQ